MNKFLELVEENSPEQDIDALTDAKRSLQRLLLKSKIEAYGKAFEDILSVRLDDGRVVELEVKDVQPPAEDNQSGAGGGTSVGSEVGAIAAIAGLPDQGALKGALTKTGRRLKRAKQTMASAAEKIAKKLDKAAG